MKKLLMTLAAAVAFAACSDDPEAWEKLPVAPISGEDAELTVNGETMEAGSVQLTVTSATQGTLLLEKVLHGYDAITMDVALTERTDGTGTFDIQGETDLTKSPAINALDVKAAAEPAIYHVSVTGSISPEGTAVVNLTSVLSPEAQGGVTGKWTLLTNLEMDDSGVPVNYPLWITWSAIDPEQPNAELTATIVRTFGSSLLYQFLHSVTFSEDGTVTAEYWDGEGFNMETDMATYLMSGVEYNDDWTEAFMVNLHPDKPWSESPKKLLYWHVQGDYLYIVPDIEAILAQIQQDTGSDVSAGLDGIADLLDTFGDFGIQVDALLPLVMQWMETGIPFKYEKTAAGLKLYADKEMCRPVIEALLPALPKLDQMIAELANSEDPMIQMLPMMIPMMLGIENLAALDPIWKTNTNEFKFSLNFEN